MDTIKRKFMNILMAIILVLITLTLIIAVRNMVVFNIRTQAIKSIFSYNDWREKEALLENPSYDAMIFDLTRWTYRQYYPEHYARDQQKRSVQN